MLPQPLSPLHPLTQLRHKRHVQHPDEDQIDEEDTIVDETVRQRCYHARPQADQQGAGWHGEDSAKAM